MKNVSRFVLFRPFFGAESGAKVNHFFEPPKLSEIFFSKIFQNLFAYPFEKHLFRKAGAKVNRFLESPKHFATFSQKKTQKVFCGIPEGLFIKTAIYRTTGRITDWASIFPNHGGVPAHDRCKSFGYGLRDQ